MSIVAAYKPRPFVMSRDVAEIELVPATVEDFAAYCPVKEKDVLRLNLIFWLRSSINGKLQQHPMATTARTNKRELFNYLKLNMVYIPRSPFKEL